MAPVFYTWDTSVWCSVAQLAVDDLEYSDKIEKRLVNLITADNLAPEVLKINPTGTLPAIATGDAFYTSTAEVVSYLASNATIKVAPATALTEAVHSDELDPNFAFLSARNEEELAKVSVFGKVYSQNRYDALKRYAATPDAEPFRAFYEKKIALVADALALYSGTAPDAAKQGYFARSTTIWASFRTFIFETLPAALAKSEGQFLGGERPGEDDFHVGGWLSRISLVSGATTVEQAPGKLEERLGGPIPESVQKYLQAWGQRSSWQKVYADRLH